LDTELWEKIAQGDQEAFLKLYHSQYQKLYAFGCRVCADREVVKDCIHEMFCELWTKRHQVQKVENSRAYLFTYLKRKLLKELQRVGQIAPTENPEPASPKLYELSYEEILVRSQADEHTKAKLQAVLQRLTKSQLEIIELKFYRELNYDEIASLLSLQPRTVYNQVYEALKQLRKYMKVFLPIGLSATELFKIFLK
jgi:RNA polymerase sigma factor (sigma-70 family)